MQRPCVRSITALLAPLTALALLAAPASAESPAYSPDTQYVAMGDSFSSGLGAPGATVDCGRSPQGYPTLWANAHGITKFTDVTCGGAVTDDVLAEQISGLNAETDVVTITIGGNDTAWGDQVLTCMLSGDTACTDTVDEAVAGLPAVATKVDATYAAMRQAAPNAKVYVLGYPNLFEETAGCAAWAVPNQYQRKELNRFASALNQSLARSAAKAGFSFTDAQPFFAGHAVCSSQSWINPVLALPPLHPNADGYRLGYLAALNSATG
ncbi:SGNH/GDSL hydrolase family protein [Actinomadura bangladeshensis]|jgi:lysophospholipase L1-like esterase|uniref:SGNH/GDSL hydrolase family protein n=1 Tax=Actinomadura bangladeshensis TaxID=453573 RepID=A0A6L9QST4_9ACTN|nr:SGNH/GDSL hydrolase family protein [Actinomadura bangladeshensis]NEA28491.1 SGNH/GDSL hydrolase family protein [Actinomadura bangladeshensis]